MRSSKVLLYSMKKGLKRWSNERKRECNYDDELLDSCPKNGCTDKQAEGRQCSGRISRESDVKVGWMVGWSDGRTDVRTKGWTVRLTDGWIEFSYIRQLIPRVRKKTIYRTWKAKKKKRNQKSIAKKTANYPWNNEKDGNREQGHIYAAAGAARHFWNCIFSKFPRLKGDIISMGISILQYRIILEMKQLLTRMHLHFDLQKRQTFRHFCPIYLE